MYSLFLSEINEIEFSRPIFEKKNTNINIYVQIVQ